MSFSINVIYEYIYTLSAHFEQEVTYLSLGLGHTNGALRQEKDLGQTIRGSLLSATGRYGAGYLLFCYSEWYRFKIFSV